MDLVGASSEDTSPPYTCHAWWEDCFRVDTANMEAEAAAGAAVVAVSLLPWSYPQSYILGGASPHPFTAESYLADPF